MTDKNVADTVYIEPLNGETVKKIIEKEIPDAIIGTKQFIRYGNKGTTGKYRSKSFRGYDDYVATDAEARKIAASLI